MHEWFRSWILDVSNENSVVMLVVPHIPKAVDSFWEKRNFGSLPRSVILASLILILYALFSSSAQFWLMHKQGLISYLEPLPQGSWALLSSCLLPLLGLLYCTQLWTPYSLRLIAWKVFREVLPHGYLRLGFGIPYHGRIYLLGTSSLALRRVV